MSRLTYSEQKKRNEMWKKGYLWCRECKQFLHSSNFYKKQNGSTRPSDYGYREYCKNCNQKQRFERSDEFRIYLKNKRVELKREAVNLMGDKCQRCGYNEFMTALDFHHVYPSIKKDQVSTLLNGRGGIEGAWQEMDKCCLLCGNCHGAYTGNEWRAEFVKRDGCGYTVGKSLPLDDNRYNQKPTRLEQEPLPLIYEWFESKQLKLFD